MTGMMLLMLPAMGSTLDFTPRIVTMRSFFAQQNHLGGNELGYTLSKLHEHLTSLP